MLNTSRPKRGRGRPAGAGWRTHALPLVAACVALPLAWSASAGADTPGRYTMSPTEGGVIRLDRETGAMAFCTGKDGEWSCKDMPESENALRKRIEQLEAEKRAFAAERELWAGSAGENKSETPDTDAPPSAEAVPTPPGNLPVPNERDVDKLFDYVEGMVKKFKERIERLEREAEKKPEIPL